MREKLFLLALLADLSLSAGLSNKLNSSHDIQVQTKFVTPLKQIMKTVKMKDQSGSEIGTTATNFQANKSFDQETTALHQKSTHSRQDTTILLHKPVSSQKETSGISNHETTSFRPTATGSHAKTTRFSPKSIDSDEKTVDLHTKSAASHQETTSFSPKFHQERTSFSPKFHQETTLVHTESNAFHHETNGFQSKSSSSHQETTAIYQKSTGVNEETTSFLPHTKSTDAIQSTSGSHAKSTGLHKVTTGSSALHTKSSDPIPIRIDSQTKSTASLQETTRWQQSHKISTNPNSFFLCGDGHLVPWTSLCDGKIDCSDRSDEITMKCNILAHNFHQCSKKMFPCNNGQCISKQKLCDGQDDCQDHSDEDDSICKKTTGNLLECADGHLVKDGFLCDGINDCYDQSDEVRCPEACTGFLCDSGRRCVFKDSICDGFPNCFDGTDENCFNCSESQILCPRGQCIALEDLPLAGEECWGPEGVDYAYLERMCTAPRLFCDLDKCLPPSNKCDGKVDCTDSTDERTVRDGQMCSCFQFVCNNKKCISEDVLCDGYDDCGDGSDENAFFATCSGANVKSCSNSTFFSGMFQCHNGLCIEKIFQHDGRDDCGDYSDESYDDQTPLPVDLMCSGHTCSNGNCILAYQVCDGNNDCADNSDESDCFKLGFTDQFVLVIYVAVAGGITLLIITIVLVIYKRRKSLIGSRTRAQNILTAATPDFPPNYWEIVKIPMTAPASVWQQQDPSYVPPQTGSETALLQ